MHRFGTGGYAQVNHRGRTKCQNSSSFRATVHSLKVFEMWFITMFIISVSGLQIDLSCWAVKAYRQNQAVVPNLNLKVAFLIHPISGLEKLRHSKAKGTECCEWGWPSSVLHSVRLSDLASGRGIGALKPSENCLVFCRMNHRLVLLLPGMGKGTLNDWPQTKYIFSMCSQRYSRTSTDSKPCLWSYLKCRELLLFQ